MKVYIIIATLVILALGSPLFEASSGLGFFLTTCMWITFVGVPIYLSIQIKEAEKKSEEEIIALSNMTEDEKRNYYEEKKKKEEDNIIDYTILVNTDDRKSLGSAVVRGAVGGAVLGPLGMVGGAVSGKNKSTTTFTVVYKSGRRNVVTVDNDSESFYELAKYLKQ